MLIDTHAHLYWKSFEVDFDQMIQRTLDAGVTTIINVGVDVNLSQTALEQVENQLSKISGLQAYSTIGIHPHEAIKYLENPDESIHKDTVELSRVHSQNPQKVMAVGECGLDYFFDNNPDHNLASLRGRSGPTSLSTEQQKELQRKLFQAQIELAKKLNLPLIVHCRDDRSKNPENSEAWNEVLTLVGDHPAILHCYSGMPEITQKVLHSPNLLVSFAATITYPKNDYLREAAKILPLEKIVLETDSPFLPSQVNRGKRNEPQTVKEIAQLIADLKGVSFGEVANQTTENVKKLFKI